MIRSVIFALALAMTLPAAAVAQGTSIAFSGLVQNTTEPVEVTADSLSIDQANGSAVFRGNVLVVQGGIRMSAAEIVVIYAADQAGRIKELRASGGVTLVSPSEAAEAGEAIYALDSGTVSMTGNVLLTQGSSALSADSLVIDLTAGTGLMQGRVRTVFQPGGN